MTREDEPDLDRRRALLPSEDDDEEEDAEADAACPGAG